MLIICLLSFLLTYWTKPADNVCVTYSHLQAPAKRPEVRFDAQLAGDQSNAFANTADHQPGILARSG